MKHTYIPVMALAVAVSVTGLTLGMTGDSHEAVMTKTMENVDMYEGVNVRAYKNGELVAEEHNTLMEGKLAIENMMTGSDGHVWDTITVGNGSAPSTGDGTLDSEWNSCGLSPQSTSFDHTSTNGKWNLTVTFDSITCDDIIVNTTAQYSSGAQSDEDYFAGADLGRDINLYSGDSLTIEWSNEVS